MLLFQCVFYRDSIAYIFPTISISFERFAAKNINHELSTFDYDSTSFNDVNDYFCWMRKKREKNGREGYNRRKRGRKTNLRKERRTRGEGQIMKKEWEKKKEGQK